MTKIKKKSRAIIKPLKRAGMPAMPITTPMTMRKTASPIIGPKGFVEV
jgi:hypothetical protein